MTRRSLTTATITTTKHSQDDYAESMLRLQKAARGSLLGCCGTSFSWSVIRIQIQKMHLSLTLVYITKEFCTEKKTVAVKQTKTNILTDSGHRSILAQAQQNKMILQSNTPINN